MTSLSTHRVDTSKLKSGRIPDGNLEPGYALADRYLILGILGVGGMGSVYQARDLHFANVTKSVAVKEMINVTPDAALKEMILRNFEREADLLATLNHPAIPEIYDYFTADERSYLVMEYIKGKDLEAAVNETQGFLPEETVVQWALQLCDVLSFLHNHKPPIVFRDMKPSNVMIDHHNHIRLIDFGIAKNFQGEQKGTMIGTEGYSPPEQYRGEASPAGDIYALGATLHHLLTKQDPRLEPPFSFSERPVRKANPAVSAGLEAIINTALAYNAGERFVAAADLKAALVALNAGPAAREGAGATSARGAGQTARPRTQATDALGLGEVVPLWSFSCEDEIRGSPVVADGVLYVGSYDHNLYAINAADGKFLWKFATDGGIAATPVVHSHMIYVGSEDKRLYAISARSGRIQWSYGTEGPIRGSARIAHDHIFFGSDDGYLHAVNLTTGRRAWRTEAAGPVRSTPAVAEERVFFGCEAGDFYCLDFAGVVKWPFKAKRSITSSPTLGSGLVYVGSADWTLYAMELSSGFVAWRQRTKRAIISSPCLAGNVVYVGSADDNLYAFDARSGRPAWAYETGGQVNSSPVHFKGTVYVGSVDGCLHAVEATTGKLRWKFATQGPVVATPFAANDTVYIASTDHQVYALTA